MAFGNGNGAASAASGAVVNTSAWGDSSTRVISVLVLGVPLILANAITTGPGFTFVETVLTNSKPTNTPNWATAQLQGGTLIAESAFLLILVLLAAVSEGAGSLAAAILAAIWVAWLLGNGTPIFQGLSASGNTAKSESSGTKKAA